MEPEKLMQEHCKMTRRYNTLYCVEISKILKALNYIWNI
jgi:hypothetical protein